MIPFWYLINMMHRVVDIFKNKINNVKSHHIFYASLRSECVFVFDVYVHMWFGIHKCIQNSQCIHTYLYRHNK